MAANEVRCGAQAERLCRNKNPLLQHFQTIHAIWIYHDWGTNVIMHTSKSLQRSEDDCLMGMMHHICFRSPQRFVPPCSKKKNAQPQSWHWLPTSVYQNNIKTTNLIDNHLLKKAHPLLLEAPNFRANGLVCHGFEDAGCRPVSNHIIGSLNMIRWWELVCCSLEITDRLLQVTQFMRQIAILK